MTHSFPTRRSSDLRNRRSSVPRTALFSLSIRLCLLWLTMRSPRAVGARRARRDSMQEVREDSRLGSRPRSEEHTSELQSLMRISYAVFCLKKKKSIAQHMKPRTCDKNTYKH